MYAAVLWLHSWLRWVVLVLGLLAWAHATFSRPSAQWTPGTEPPLSRWFLRAFDLQFMLGLLMYVAFSPITRTAMSDVGAIMGQTLLRFYTVEHPTGMIVALTCAHIGHARAIRAATGIKARRTTAIYFGIALVVMLLSIPWPFVPAGRPYFRW
jgi:hypothetical protein